jgi:hypothetical protein
MKSRPVFFLLFLMLGTGSPVLARQWKPVVLKASSVSDDGSGNIVIQLSSGKTITVPKTDLSNEWSAAVGEALVNQQRAKEAISSAEPPSDQQAASLIRGKCAQDWPDDYKMRKYCEDKQYQALRVLRSRSMVGEPLAGIRTKCAAEWPDDFSMRDYCEEKQIEALRELAK